MPSAVILLSGGLDSATTLAIARAAGFTCSALTIDYGQRHRVELTAARNVAAHLGVYRHIILPLDLRAFGGSALTADIPVPKDRPENSGGVPSTYVPARNLIFISLAAAFAETINARDLFLGVNAVDFSGYPDCRPAFIQSMQQTLNLATKAGIQSSEPWFRLHTPIITLNKPDIIRRGTALGLNYALTHSCYDPVSRDGATYACGHCDACLIRAKGFGDACVPDPTPYA